MLEWVAKIDVYFKKYKNINALKLRVSSLGSTLMS